MKTRLIAILITLTTIASFPSCDLLINLFPPSDDAATDSIDSFMNHEAIISTPMSDDLAFIEVNDNKPQFTEEDFNNGVYYYKLTPLDELGRVGVAIGLFDAEHMPDEERGDISSVKPTGWVQKRYDGEYLYNRCHLIGYQLSNENANELNLITGTRYFNTTGMLPFENQVAEYIKEQNSQENKHVLYRVTPIYKENELVARGVQMEAYSVEDNGRGICFNVFVYNVQPGINIDYATGESLIQQ